MSDEIFPIASVRIDVIANGDNKTIYFQFHTIDSNTTKYESNSIFREELEYILSDEPIQNRVLNSVLQEYIYHSKYLSELEKAMYLLMLKAHWINNKYYSKGNNKKNSWFSKFCFWKKN